MQDQSQIKALIKLLSEERLSNYLHYSRHHKVSAIEMYKWNTALSQSLYPSLQTIEVIFRNALYKAITQYTQNPSWLTSNRLLFKSEQDTVNKEIERLTKIKPSFPTGKLIAELKFGFWTSLLDKRYEQILWTKIIKLVFPNLKKSLRTRQVISRRFNAIRKLRNRVFHYEPIWHWNDLSIRHQQIIEAITWIDPLALDLIIDLNHFNQIFKSHPRDTGK